MKTITKTKGQIVKSNLFTLFNLLNLIIAALLFLVKAYSNMAFIAVVLLNTVIGIAQELKAKKLVDDLSLLNRPRVTVKRDGQERTIDAEEVRSGEIMLLQSGMQICCDAQVLSGCLEVNESLLTGESDGVVKRTGDSLYSGSFATAGKCEAVVTAAGAESYAARLTEEVRKEKQIQSELLGSMKKVTRFTSFLIVPLGILLFLEALLLRETVFSGAVVSSSAALLGMLPKGLVLLISVSLAAGVIRLAKKRILVQNLYALETLAHVDVLCLDKTGTLTNGSMKVKDMLWLSEEPRCHGVSEEEAEKLLRAYLYASDDVNATTQALKKNFIPEKYGEVSAKIAFSSQRKWGSVSLEGIGTIFVGAPERLLENRNAKEEEWLDQGLRVLAVGYCGQSWENEKELPKNLEPLYLMALEDSLRKNARRTMEYFAKEGVDVKVISGDHVRTASVTAKRAGLKRWYDAVDMAQESQEADYDSLCERYSVFARVTPRQKQELIKALKRRGHKVAMIGDGVNDLLALREADCSVAVAQGSDASRQISQIVLLESDFSYLPEVVREGRKVINNVTRTAGVFFVKTLYSLLVSLLCLAFNQPFPFIPIQITLVDACMEAWPSFLTIFESDTRKPEGSFLKTALRNALPFALAVTGAIAAVSMTTSFTEAQKQTLMYLALAGITMAAVVKSCMPLSALRAAACLTMAAGTLLALLLFPGMLEISPITLPMLAFLPVLAAGILLFLVLYLGFQKGLLNELAPGSTMQGEQH